ncbi:uncharacterized protein LOC114679037 [Macaca mulatta]
MQAGGSLEVLALAVKTAPPVSHPAPLHAHLALLRPSLERHTGKSCAGRRWLGMLRLELAVCKPASPGLCPHAPSSQPLSTVAAPASRSCFPIHPFPDLPSKYCGPGGPASLRLHTLSPNPVVPAAWLSGKLSRSAWSTDPAAVKWEEALGGGAAREREKQRNPVSFPDVHNYRTAPWLPPYRLGQSGQETLPAPSGSGRVGGHYPAYSPAPHCSHGSALGHSEESGQSPCLGFKPRAISCQVSHPSPSWVIFPERDRADPGGGRTVRQPGAKGSVSHEGRSRDGLYPCSSSWELRRRTGPRAGAPRHPNGCSRTLIRANKAWNLWWQRPQEPGSHQETGRAGAQGHYKFLALHGAQPRPHTDNKRFSPLPHRLRGTPSPTWLWTKTALFYPTPSSPRGQNPFLRLRHRARELPRIPPSRARSAPCLARVRMSLGSRTHTHPREEQPYAPSRPGAAPGVCATRVGKLSTCSRAYSGARGLEERQAGLTVPPQDRATLEKQRHKTK